MRNAPDRKVVQARTESRIDGRRHVSSESVHQMQQKKYIPAVTPDRHLRQTTKHAGHLIRHPFAHSRMARITVYPYSITDRSKERCIADTWLKPCIDPRQEMPV
ncbi:hypothetical protein WM40_21710 [Robbsia andropogonis]|uniref:Uncharacterized protein n=1 Tax=Robbsia andropogonis TaxID=28092 RepID=A0A0F5JVK3_9BURK|nr:hypothetical protein WM40_21710 [Robbsia andropogonis]